MVVEQFISFFSSLGDISKDGLSFLYLNGSSKNQRQHDTRSLAKPPRFSRDNFSLCKFRMRLFFAATDPKIPYFIDGPFVPFTLVQGVLPLLKLFLKGIS